MVENRNHIPRFQRLAGFLALLAGPMAWGSLLLGLSVVDFDFERFSDPRAVLSLGTSAAHTLRWSYWLSMSGAYLFLLPITLWLGSRFPHDDPLMVRGYTLCGLAYLGLGATGAAVLAVVWPALITLSVTTAPEQQPDLLLAFTTATTIAEAGFQGVLQNIVGGVWWMGIGSLLWRSQRLLGGFTYGLGAMLGVTALGTLLNSEVLNLLGLTATILLAPLWSMWMGMIALRLYQLTES